MRTFTGNPELFIAYEIARAKVFEFHRLRRIPVSARYENQINDLARLDTDTWRFRSVPSNLAARTFGIARRTMHEWITRGEADPGQPIRAYRHGRDWYVCMDDVADAVKAALPKPLEAPAVDKTLDVNRVLYVCERCEDSGLVTTYDLVPYGSGDTLMPTTDYCTCEIGMALMDEESKIELEKSKVTAKLAAGEGCTENLPAASDPA